MSRVYVIPFTSRTKNVVFPSIRFDMGPAKRGSKSKSPKADTAPPTYVR